MRIDGRNLTNLLLVVVSGLLLVLILDIQRFDFVPRAEAAAAYPSTVIVGCHSGTYYSAINMSDCQWQPVRVAADGRLLTVTTK